MKILVSVDNNGEFHVANPTDRVNVLNIIKKVNNGEFYYTVLKDDNIIIKENLNEYCCQEWNSIVKHFVKRGGIKYSVLTESTSIGCKCSTNINPKTSNS